MSTTYKPIMGENFNAKFAFLADSDGNSTKDASYAYPHVSHTGEGLLYNHPALAVHSYDSAWSNKVNYYVFAADSWGVRPDGISCQGLTLADLSGVKLSGSITNSNAWITVYTEPKNDDNDKASWYRSRYNFTGQYLTTQNFNGAADVTVDLTGWKTLATSTTNKSDAQASTDTILAIAINTNSSESDEYDLLISNVELILADGTSKSVSFQKQVNTESIDVFSAVNVGEQDANILQAIVADGATTNQTTEGLVTENLGNGKKINHYLWAADPWGVREELYSVEGLKMKDLDSLVLKGVDFIGGNTPYAFVRIYTKADGNSDKSWYKSNFLITPFMNSFGDYTFALGLTIGNYKPIGSTNGDSLSLANSLANCAEEEILAISVQTDSVDAGPFAFKLAGAELHLEDGSVKAIDLAHEGHKVYADLTQEALSTHATIADAINAANEGHIVIVQKGVYNGNITINKNITLMGPSGEVAQINGTININGSATLKQLKLVQSGDAQLVDATASQNAANDSLVVEDCVLELSGASSNKTALYVKNYRGAGSSIKNNTINHNSESATGRRGVQLSEVSNVTMEGNTIDMGVTEFTNPNTVYSQSTYACQLVNRTIQNENINVSGNTLQNSFAGLDVWSMRGADGLTFSNNTVSNVIRGLGLGIARVGGEQAPAGVFNNVQVDGNTFSGVALVAVSFGAISTGNAAADGQYGVNDVLPLRNSNIVAPSLFVGDVAKVAANSTINVSGTDIYKGTMPSEQIKELYLPAGDNSALVASINGLYTTAGYTGFEFKKLVKVELLDLDQTAVEAVAERHEVADLTTEQKTVVAKVVTVLDNALPADTQLSAENVAKVAEAIKTSGVNEKAVEIVPTSVDNNEGAVVIDLVPNCALVIVDSDVYEVSPGQETFLVPQQPAPAPEPAPAPAPAPAPSDPVPVVFSEGDEVQYNADGLSPTTSTVDADGKLSFFISEYNISFNITENTGKLLIPTAPVEAYKDDNSDYYYIFYSDGVWKMFSVSGSGQNSITEGTWEYV